MLGSILCLCTVAVTRIANRIASQHLWGHVTSSVSDHLKAHIPFPIGGPLDWNQTVSEIFNVECNAML